MADVLSEPSTFSPAVRAENILDYVLNENSTIESIRNGVGMSAVDGHTDVPVINPAAMRTKTRVLFVSTDPTLLAPGTELRDRLTSLNTVFDEVHMLVVETSWKKRVLTDKIADRVWVYGTTASHWWSVARAAEELVHEQLEFTAGFRIDIIVALDPFLAGYIAERLADRYERPFQVHVLNDIFSDSFMYSSRHAAWLRRLARHVLHSTRSVCVVSETVKEQVKKEFKHLSEPVLLPRFYDIKNALAKTDGPTIVPSKLARFKFVVLFVGTLDHDSTFYRAIDAARTMLRSPAIALVVIGDGPMKKEFKKRAEIFGVSEQIIFEPSSVDVVSYMRSAQLLIATDTTPESEEVIIKAAAAGLPILAARTELREDIFTDDINAFLCNKDDTIEFSQKLSKFLNNSAIRVQFAREARTTIKDRLHEDPEVFKLAYRDAIESVLAFTPLAALR